MSPTRPRTPSFAPRDAIEKHARFRHMCTSFFVDLVSSMCFKDNRPPHKDVVDALLSLLFVQKELLRDAPHSELLSSRLRLTPVRPPAPGAHVSPSDSRAPRAHQVPVSVRRRRGQDARHPLRGAEAASEVQVGGPGGFPGGRGRLLPETPASRPLLAVCGLGRCGWPGGQGVGTSESVP